MQHERVTDTQKIVEIIKDTWTGDDTFFKKYAINIGQEASINDTTAKVLGFIQAYDAEFYGLCDADGKFIGYVNVSKPMCFLQSFGIKKDCRTVENKSSFLFIIDSLLPSKVIVSVYKKNKRAIDFFLDNGYEEQKEEVITLIKSN